MIKLKDLLSENVTKQSIEEMSVGDEVYIKSETEDGIIKYIHSNQQEVDVEVKPGRVKRYKFSDIEVIDESLFERLNEDEYDRLRDKYGRINRRKTGKRKGTPESNKIYLDVSDSEGKKLQKDFRGKIFQDSDGEWYMGISDSLLALEKIIKDKMDTKKTDSKLVKRVNKMKTI